jgi:DNA-directed RNA polymerase subunit N (RpoN/RPB10)
MIFPIRCFTCNKVIGGKWQEYQNSLNKGETAKNVLDKMGMKRYCCRRMFLGHVELIDDILKNHYPLN